MRKNMRWMLLIALCLAVLVSCGKQEAAPAEPEQEAETVVVPEPVTEPAEEHIHLCLGQNVQSGCVYAADLYFSLHGNLLWKTPGTGRGRMALVCPGGRKMIPEM